MAETIRAVGTEIGDEKIRAQPTPSPQLPTGGKHPVRSPRAYGAAAAAASMLAVNTPTAVSQAISRRGITDRATFRMGVPFPATKPSSALRRIPCAPQSFSPRHCRSLRSARLPSPSTIITSTSTPRACRAAQRRAAQWLPLAAPARLAAKARPARPIRSPANKDQYACAQSRAVRATATAQGSNMPPAPAKPCHPVPRTVKAAAARPA